MKAVRLVPQMNRLHTAIHQHQDTHTQNLCSPSRQSWHTPLGNCRISWIPPCLCTCVCCRSRRFLRRTRSRLSCVGVRACLPFTKTALVMPHHHEVIKLMVLRMKVVRLVPHTKRLHTTNHQHQDTYTHAHTHTHTHTHTEPVQPFAPELAYPAGQSPHFMDPTVFMHLRLLSQPPLLDAHSFTSDCTGLCVYVCMCVSVCVSVLVSHSNKGGDGICLLPNVLFLTFFCHKKSSNLLK